MTGLYDFAAALIDLMFECFVGMLLGVVLWRRLGGQAFELIDVILVFSFLFIAAVLARPVLRSDKRLVEQRSRVMPANTLVSTASWGHFFYAVLMIIFGTVIATLGTPASGMGWAMLITFAGFAVLRATMIIVRRRR